VQVFDHIDPGKLERRDAELWTVAITMIAVLAVGMALLMYFSSHWNPALPRGVSLREIIFSFCLLCLLLVAYLVERQLTVRPCAGNCGKNGRGRQGCSARQALTCLKPCRTTIGFGPD